jgi:catechol 2,3-dioxygenase-like lactoylglutathione lyase family enzyme
MKADRKETLSMRSIHWLKGLLFTALLISVLGVGNAEEKKMTSLGQFSVSLAVKDLQASKSFYEKLGFTVFPPEKDWPQSYGKDWVILQNGDAIIGLFQGMFDKNTLTFNPKDVREVQRELKKQGLSFATEADETTKGPASAMLFDPDGNPVLLDQHHH